MKKIFYLGSEESYSYIVTKQVIFDRNYTLTPLQTFSEIVEATKKTKNAIGVLPIENSITSDVHENIDYLFNTNLTILYEAFLRIKLNIIGFTDATIDTIKTVYSHERALAQSSNFIKEHHITPKETSSTSAGRDIMIEKHDKTVGVIGSTALSTHPQLKILQENIGNDEYNMTRFVFVGEDTTELVTGIKNKASVIFRLPHIPGALAQLLTTIADTHINVTKIESRPIPGTNWEYQFWIDVEKTAGPLEVETLDALFMKNALSYRIVGIYPSGEIFES